MNKTEIKKGTFSGLSSFSQSQQRQGLSADAGNLDEANGGIEVRQTKTIDIPTSTQDIDSTGKLTTATVDQNVAQREACCSLAERARHSFQRACDPGDADEAEALFASVVDNIIELWNYALLRDLPFRDLLAALESALRYKHIEDLTNPQREAIKKAFQNLVRLHITRDDVTEHLNRLGSSGIDLGALTRPRLGKKIKNLTIEFEE